MTSIYDTQELISAKTVPKIDCHTHIVTAAIRDEYFSRTDGLALVMQMPDSIMKNPDVWQRSCQTRGCFFARRST